MQTIRGNTYSAIVYNDVIEDTAYDQIIAFLNSPACQGNVVIMPDCHAGAGCVIGFTMRLCDNPRIVPNLIGVDIGCGVTAINIGRRELDFKFIDFVINKTIPHGFEVHETEKRWDKMAKLVGVRDCLEFRETINNIAKIVGARPDRVWTSLGTLGGGNHFIEIDRDDLGDQWLVVHSGSRGFGLAVANHHQEVAYYAANGEELRTLEEIKLQQDRAKADRSQLIKHIIEECRATGVSEEVMKMRVAEARRESATKVFKGKTGLEYLEGDKANEYLDHMRECQIYAQINRRLILDLIMRNCFGDRLKYFEIVESVHNYIDFEDFTIRKGAIRAHAGERVIIPFNMRDGSIIGIGKGNPDWNCSAPHGAGRVMGRREAKRTLKEADFIRTMAEAGVYSTCVSADTIDESPAVYKDPKTIEQYLAASVDVTLHLRPVYNRKSTQCDMAV
jgi:RNA-splicing ligase RtcB